MSAETRSLNVRIKICGLARETDAREAARLGADFLGLVLARSPRGVIAAEVSSWVLDLRAEFPESSWVGVFVRPSIEEVTRAVLALHLDYVQIHGMAPDWVPEALPRPWIRVLSPRAARNAPVPGLKPFATLIDTPRPDGYGGTGEAFDWSQLDPLPRGERVFLAGGLDAENVVEAIGRVCPWGVDASSRLEARPGQKDPERVRAFVAAVRGIPPQKGGQHE